MKAAFFKWQFGDKYILSVSVAGKLKHYASKQEWEKKKQTTNESIFTVQVESNVKNKQTAQMVKQFKFLILFQC